MKFSIITPSYNQGKYIERTLKSVLSQEGVTFEYIIFDGGSTDQTIDILNICALSHSKQMRWISEKDRGQTHAINKGISITSGEIIGWLNSDDVYYTDALRVVADYFAAHPEVDVVYGSADHIDTDDRYIDSYPVEQWNIQRMRETCIICQPAAFFRRRVVESHGLLDESLDYCMDYEFWLRLGSAGIRFSQINRKLAGSRMYAQNKTLGSTRAVHAEINDMMKKKFGRAPDSLLFAYAHVVAEECLDRNRYPRLFLYLYGAQAFFAAWRWNGRISREMCRKFLARFVAWLAKKSNE